MKRLALAAFLLSTRAFAQTPIYVVNPASQSVAARGDQSGIIEIVSVPSSSVPSDVCWWDGGYVPWSGITGFGDAGLWRNDGGTVPMVVAEAVASRPGTPPVNVCVSNDCGTTWGSVKHDFDWYMTSTTIQEYGYSYPVYGPSQGPCSDAGLTLVGTGVPICNEGAVDWEITDFGITVGTSDYLVLDGGYLWVELIAYDEHGINGKKIGGTPVLVSSTQPLFRQLSRPIDISGQIVPPGTQTAAGLACISNVLGATCWVHGYYILNTGR